MIMIIIIIIKNSQTWYYEPSLTFFSQLVTSNTRLRHCGGSGENNFGNLMLAIILLFIQFCTLLQLTSTIFVTKIELIIIEF
jgi:hypothetical protein